MELKKLEVEVSKEAHELGEAIAKLVIATKEALKDGFQVGQDVPAVVMTAFASLVRKAAAAAYGYGTDTALFTNAETKDVVVPQWGITPRQMMINVGEAMRRLDPDHWIKLWRPKYTKPDTLVIVTDVRRLNEAKAIYSLSEQKSGQAQLVLLQRPGVCWDGSEIERLANDTYVHYSMKTPGIFDVFVKNDGDVASLRRHADRIVRRVLDKATKKS